MNEQLTKEEYNEVPVHYCQCCLSLDIRISEDDGDYCNFCGSTDTWVTTIENWEDLYENSYGGKYLKLNPKVWKI